MSTATVCVLGSREFCRCLQEEGQAGGDLAFVAAHSLESASQALRETPCEVALVQAPRVGQPGAREVRALAEQAPVSLLVVAETSDAARVAELLLAGAHDVLPATLSPREIITHLRAALRRRQAAAASATRSSAVLTAGPLLLDTGAYRVTMGDRPLSLPPREFALLAYLMTHLGQACRRPDLLREVWSGEVSSHSRTLDVHIGRLRARLQKAGDPGLCLETLPGVGYRLQVG